MLQAFKGFSVFGFGLQEKGSSSMSQKVTHTPSDFQVPTTIERTVKAWHAHIRVQRKPDNSAFGYATQISDGESCVSLYGQTTGADAEAEAKAYLSAFALLLNWLAHLPASRRDNVTIHTARITHPHLPAALDSLLTKLCRPKVGRVRHIVQQRLRAAA
jgi:hypothetical protein